MVYGVKRCVLTNLSGNNRSIFDFNHQTLRQLQAPPLRLSVVMGELADFNAEVSRQLLSLRVAGGWWEGHLSSSALATATACMALHLVDETVNRACVNEGVRWLMENQNPDGGWGDTTVSKSNLSTTLLVWSALGLFASPDTQAVALGVEAYIRAQVGSLEPAAIVRAVIGRYGKDKTFSVPILMTAAIGGRLGADGWRRVLPLPFELAMFPRAWFGAIGLPVVSYALPALIAIGFARYRHLPPAWWNPLRWVRAWAWSRVGPMLREIQPSTGGYLEATPLTSFVTMALASAGENEHPCLPDAVKFLRDSMRADGSWPIDTNLATWGTTLAVKALGPDFDGAEQVRQWLLSQQYKSLHPFTNAAPGGWAWTPLPGGVPDADDTAGALVALHKLGGRAELASQAEAGVLWLLGLQNRDGGMPTFCRGWGTLPFDRSTPELTAHALWAWSLWEDIVGESTRRRIKASRLAALKYLRKTRHGGQWCWEPLWFGNEHAEGEINLVYGTAMVLHYLREAGVSGEIVDGATAWLAAAQNEDGSWGAKGSIEETAVAVTALQGKLKLELQSRLLKARDWLERATGVGERFPPSPIGLYFARLWYHEQLYPVVWTLGALRD